MKNRHKISWKIAGLVLVAIFLGLSSCDEAVVTNPYNATLVFEQIDYDMNGFVVINSSFGRVILTYDGSSSVLYFNLVVNGNWIIQNIAVLSHKGPGLSQSISYLFDLGVNDGTEVTQLQYALDLTTSVLATMPSETNTATVIDGSIVFYSGETVSPMGTGYTPQPPSLIAGGEVDKSAKHEGNFENGDYNQECRHKECVPAAVSNSLNWLKDKHDLTYPEDPTIDRMKEATDWDEIIGCSGWWDDKDHYMSMMEYPITTTTTNDFDAVIDAIAAGKDVELGYVCPNPDPPPTNLGHRAMVVGITKYTDGTYSIDIAHDTDQAAQDQPANNGGTEVSTLTYDPTTGEFTSNDLPWDTATLINFVIESKSE